MAQEPPDALSDFELRGVWYLADAPAKAVPGIVKYEAEGSITLQLDGVLGDFKAAFSLSPGHVPIILGRTNEGRPCTLWDNIRTQGQFRSSGSHSSAYTCHWLLLGGHFARPDLIQFRSVKVHFTNLEAWVGEDPFQTEFPSGKTAKATMVTRCRKLKPYRYSVPCIDASVKLTGTTSAEDGFFTQRWRHTSYIQVTPRKRAHISWYLPVVHELRILLSVFMNQRIFPTTLSGVTRKMRHPGVKKLVPDEAWVYGRQLYVQRRRTAGAPDIPICFRDVKSQLGCIVQRWFGQASKYRAVHDLYFTAMYNQWLGVEFQFLCLTQAIEALHRASGRGQYMRQESFEKKYEAPIVASLPQDLPSDLRDALRSRIHYGYEHSLKKRLDDLFKSLGKEGRSLIAKDWKAFVIRTKDTRNYLTHHDAKAKHKAWRGAELLGAICRLRRLLTMLLLRTAGVDPKTVCSVISQHETFRIPEGWLEA